MAQSKGVTCVFLKLDFYHDVITIFYNRFKLLISIHIFCRAFLGSVSDYCAHKAKCPVIIVKKHAWHISYGIYRVSHLANTCSGHINPLNCHPISRLLVMLSLVYFLFTKSRHKSSEKKKNVMVFEHMWWFTRAPNDYTNICVHRGLELVYS